MNKKGLKALIGTLLASSIALTTAFTGCSLVSSNNAEDMLQVIATVNISKAKGMDEADKELIGKYKDAVGTTKIYKNELIAYYLNRGISYVNQGLSTSYVFNMLVDGLVENAVLTQYATMYLLDWKIKNLSEADAAIELYDYKHMNEIEQLEYLLTDDDAEDPDKDVKIAKYNFYSSLNAALDSYEQQYLDEEEKTSGSGSRATPSGVDTEQEDFYPADENGDLNYNVYTGYKGYMLADSGDYKNNALEGSTRATRQQAYLDFLKVFVNNGLIDPDKDNLVRVTSGIEYMNHEYTSQLENRIIAKYYDLYEKEQEDEFTDGGEYDYLDKAYKKLMGLQEEKVDESFTSKIGNISDTSFILYAPDTEGEGTYGFVYNILLPFDESQKGKLTALQNNGDNKDDAGNYTFNYYKERNNLLKQIKTTDQRQAWFNGTTSYAFDASEYSELDYFGKSDGRNWLFFENNLTKTDRYEALDKYIGKYPYNGEAVKTEDGNYYFHHTKKLTIDDMLAEFKAYIEYVLDGNGTVDLTYDAADYYAKLTEDSFYTADTKDKEKAKDKKIDYNNFIYAEGSVNLNGVDVKSADYRANIFNKDSAQYKALAAVNELQYAYTTDTGVLSQYMGYTVTLGDTTGYIKEFETAAHVAIENGPGSFIVCAGDYGWHLIYVTYTYDPDGGAVYQPNWKENVKVEGTFENFFYEWLKNNDIKEVSTTRKTEIMTQFNVKSTVNKITSAYQDLLDLDSNS